MNLFTICLRNCVCLALILLAQTSAFSQTNQSENAVIGNLKASVENNRLVINWVVAETVSINNCEVQASADGITFSTIGIVMGADPKQANSFCFKQSLNKMKTGRVFYRVVNMETSGRSTTSNIVKAVS
ncbi:MAG: hypothetical protein ABI741_07740 [Ferruginibacter sp.]